MVPPAAAEAAPTFTVTAASSCERDARRLQDSSKSRPPFSKCRGANEEIRAWRDRDLRRSGKYRVYPRTTRNWSREPTLLTRVTVLRHN